MVNFDVFDVFALIVFVVLIAAAFIVIVLIGGLPGWIARVRGHPQATAVTVAGWVGVATMGLIWPLAFIWAFIRPSPAVPASAGGGEPVPERGNLHARLQARVEVLEAGIRPLQDAKGRAV